MERRGTQETCRGPARPQPRRSAAQVRLTLLFPELSLSPIAGPAVSRHLACVHGLTSLSRLPPPFKLIDPVAPDLPSHIQPAIYLGAPRSTAHRANEWDSALTARGTLRLRQGQGQREAAAFGPPGSNPAGICRSCRSRGKTVRPERSFGHAFFPVSQAVTGRGYHGPCV